MTKAGATTPAYVQTERSTALVTQATTDRTHADKNDAPKSGDLLPERPGPRIATSTGAWCYSLGLNSRRGVYRWVGRADSGGGDSAGWQWMTILPAVLEVIRHRDGAGKLATVDYRMAIDPASDPAEHVICPTEKLRDGAWLVQLGATAQLDSRVIVAAGNAVGMLAQDAPHIEAVPSWTATGLHLPPGDVGPTGYGQTYGTEDAARTVWAEAAGILAAPGNTRAALYAGLAFAAPFVAAFSRQTFIAHACGSSSGGKSTMIRLAGSLFGPAEAVVGTWNLTKVAASEDLLRLGHLPGFRDEIGMLGRLAAREAEQLVFHIAEGASRTRARRQGGGTDRSRRWSSVLLSTGNDSLLGMATEQEGMSVRVLELESPLVADKATSERLAALSGLAPGWPLAWLRRHVSLTQAWQAIAQAERDLGADVDAGPSGRIGQNIALGVAGAALLEHLTGVPGVRAAALTAGLDVYGAAVAEMADTAMRQGDRLLSAVVEAVASDPASFPDRDVYVQRTREAGAPDAPPPLSRIHGVTYTTDAGERRIAVMRTKLTAIADAAGIVSARTGLRDLRKDGGLVVETYDSRAGLTLREWFGSEIGQVACYTFRAPTGPATPTPPAAAGLSPAVADLPLQPMPALLAGMRGLDPAAPLGGGPVNPPRPTLAIVTPPVSAPPITPRPAPAVPPPAEPARRPDRTRPAPSAPVAVTVWAVTAGAITDAATGRSVPLPAEVDLSVTVRAACQESGGSDVTLILDPAVHADYGLPATRPSPARDPWTRTGQPAKGGPAGAFLPLVHNGWHQPHKPGELPRIMPTTTLAHPRYPGRVRITPASWLQPGEFPRGDDDRTDALGLAARLIRMRELTGWTWGSSAGSTALDGLRSLIESTATRTPRWFGTVDRWPACELATAWDRPPTDDETDRRATSFDAVKNYLGAYGSALVAVDDLSWSGDPDLSGSWAGMARITVPTWPYPLVPPPVAGARPGDLVWVTAAVVRLYAELDIEVAVHEAWTAPAVQLQGLRAFQSNLRDALDGLEAGDTDAKGKPTDPDAAALWAGMKALYRTCHGKLRDPRQRRLVRPDWGYAIRDQAWTATLRKVYRAARLLPLPRGAGWAPIPRYPIRVDVDEIVYLTDPAAGEQIPAGLVLGRALGEFRVKSSQTGDGA